jgi:hypothetical protein
MTRKTEVAAVLCLSACVGVWAWPACAPSGFQVAKAAEQVAVEPRVVEAAVPFYVRGLWSMASGPLTVRVWTDGQKVLRSEVPSADGGFADLITPNLATWRFAPHLPTAFDVVFDFRTDRVCDPNSTVEARLPSTLTVLGPSLGCEAGGLPSQASASRMAGRVTCDCPGGLPIQGASVLIRRGGRPACAAEELDPTAATLAPRSTRSPPRARPARYP